MHGSVLTQPSIDIKKNPKKTLVFHILSYVSKQQQTNLNQICFQTENLRKQSPYNSKLIQNNTKMISLPSFDSKVPKH